LLGADGDRLDLERPEERRVPAEEGDVATADRAGHDHGRLALVGHPFGRDELDREHQPSTSRRSCSAFSRALSALPTLRNACSGRSSSSPLTSCSKLSTVSSTGTKMPFMPVNFSPTKNSCERNFCTLRAR